MHEIDSAFDQVAATQQVRETMAVPIADRQQAQQRGVAKAAYDAYCEAVGGKAFNGDALPPFEATPERIQVAWVSAVEAARSAHA